ncbi:MAG: hypothetical protein U0174_14610 [Polyangiaceae bacterium]
MSPLRTLTLALTATAVTFGCGNDDPTNDEIIIDTAQREARAQYDANVAFATSYAPKCTSGSGMTQRVLVTGFGRWQSSARNPSGLLVSALVPAAKYPVTAPPPAHQVDPPGPQLSVGKKTFFLPKSGSVEVCAMVVPTHWDLAAFLIAKEIASFKPSLVLMNGMAYPRQTLQFELGARNRAGIAPAADGLSPAPAVGSTDAPLIATAPASEFGRPNLMSWNAVRRSALETIAKNKAVPGQNGAFDTVLLGASFNRFPDPTNDFVCNNTTYVVGYLMDHPQPTKLMEASVPLRGKTNSLTLALPSGFENAPRDFLHWPSTLEGAQIGAAAEVLAAVIDAQLKATKDGDAPTRGDNSIAD